MRRGERTLKIGFDATPITDRKSGIGYYAENLLAAMAANNGASFTLFSNREPVFDGQTPPQTNWHDRGGFRYRAPWMQLRLPGLIRNEKLDLTHFVNFNAPAGGRFPYVVTFHDMVLFRHPEFFTWKKRILTRSLMPWVARRSRGIITVSHSVKREIVDLLGVPPEKVFVVHNAAGPGFSRVTDAEYLAEVRARHSLPHSFVLFVGTLEPRKNLVRLLHAFDEVKDRDGIQQDLVVVGGRGWKFSDVFDSVAEMRHSDSVHFLDYVDLADLPALYSLADLFAFPSVYEGFGIPLAEAMACGAPILASDTPVHREVLASAAYFADPYSAPALSCGLRDVLTDTELQTKLAASSQDRAELFSWDRAGRETLAIYQQLIDPTDREGVNPTCESGISPTHDGTSLSDDRRNSLELAVVRTVLYAHTFRFPMRIDELHRALLETSAKPGEVATVIADRRDERIARDGEFVFMRGENGLVEKRNAATKLHIAMERRHRIALRCLARLPGLKLLALSGGASHRNSTQSQDIDLFVVTRRGWLYTVYASVILLSRLLGRRRVFCANYLVDEDHLAFEARDLFSASELVHLRPLEPSPTLFVMWDQNVWIRRFYPNATPHSPRSIWSPTGTERAASNLATWLGTPFVKLVEPICRALFKRKLSRQFSGAEPGNLQLETGRLKLHPEDQRERVLDRYRRSCTQFGVEPGSLDLDESSG